MSCYHGVRMTSNIECNIYSEIWVDTVNLICATQVVHRLQGYCSGVHDFILLLKNYNVQFSRFCGIRFHILSARDWNHWKSWYLVLMFLLLASSGSFKKVFLILIILQIFQGQYQFLLKHFCSKYVQIPMVDYNGYPFVGPH